MVRIFGDLLSGWTGGGSGGGGYEQGVWEYVSDLVKTYEVSNSPEQDNNSRGQGQEVYHQGYHQDDFEDEGYGDNAVYYEVHIYFIYLFIS